MKSLGTWKNQLEFATGPSQDLDSRVPVQVPSPPFGGTWTCYKFKSKSESDYCLGLAFTSPDLLKSNRYHWTCGWRLKSFLSGLELSESFNNEDKSRRKFEVTFSMHKRKGQATLFGLIFYALHITMAKVRRYYDKKFNSIVQCWPRPNQY
jgi:hypothetical protein